MIEQGKTIDCYKNLLGWKNHYSNDIPTLPTSLTYTESGGYIQDYHSAMRLDLISAALPTDRGLHEYLETIRDSSIIDMLDKLNTIKKLSSTGRDLLANSKLLIGYGWVKDSIVNDGRFVGFQVEPSENLGVSAKINKVGFQFTAPQNNLKVYLYNSNLNDPIIKIVNTSKINGWAWVTVDFDLSGEEGGNWFVGYYQDDLSGVAINNANYDWKNTPCGSCDGGVRASAWKNVNTYMQFTPIYVPSANLVSGRKMFDLDDIYYEYKNYGMNFNISVFCNLTEFYCNNKFALKKALGLQITHNVIRDMLYGVQTNYISDKMRLTLIRDIEGDKDSNYINLSLQLENELRSVSLDMAGIGSVCLPCKNGASYGVV